jgi:DNA-directed RNA polymerase specialized sigma24 family protein
MSFRKLSPRPLQEALAEAAGNLDEYLRRPPLPFYPRLRHFAWDRLIELHRFHLNARRRSVTRERLLELPLPDQSAIILEHRLAVAGRGTPREVRGALSALSPHDKEVLALRYLEGLTAAATAWTRTWRLSPRGMASPT